MNFVKGTPIRVVLFFRNIGFSIEKVFSPIVEHGTNDENLILLKATLPKNGVRVRYLLLNLFFARKNRADINHITGDVHYLTLFLPKHNTILTIHDCVMLRQNIGVKRYLLKQLWLNWPVHHCKLITTISTFSKNEIQNTTKCNPDKIVVIHNPVSPKIIYSYKPFNTSKPRILHFAGIEHKNTFLVLKAVQFLNVCLVVIGKLDSDLLKYAESHSVQLDHFQNLTDEEVYEQYVMSDIVLFPSLYEGFGMPIIEGQATGRVVITSNLEPMIEVAGDGAHLVDPYDQQSIRDGITTVINDEVYREKLISNGLQNVKRFSIDKIIDEYKKIYYQIINSNK